MENDRDGIVSNVIWKLAERILAQGVSLIVSIILARLLLPDDYGAISMVTVFITIADVFVTAGIPSALIQKKDADDKDFSSVFYFNLCFSACLYIILFIAAPYIAAFYESQVLCSVIRVMGIRLIVASVNCVQHAYVSRHLMFKKYFWSTLFGTLVSGIIGILMAYYGYGIWALVAQYMINTCVDTVVLFITVKWRPIIYFSFSKIKKLIGFGWKMLFEGVGNCLATQLTNLIIGKRYTLEDLAYYSKGQQFPSLAVNNIAIAMASVLFPVMSNEQDDKSKVLEMLRKSVRISTYTVFPLLTGLAVTSKAFISVVLTDKWIETVPYLVVFCIINASTVGMIPRHQALNGTGRSDVFMLEHIAYRVIAIALLLLTYRISILAIVLSSIISMTLLSAIIAFTSKKYNGYAYKDQLFDILPSLAGCAFFGIPVYFESFLNFSNLIVLIIQVVTGITLYVLYSLFMNLEEFRFCLSFIRSIKNKGKKRI